KIAAALKGVVAQRLVRRLCQSCKAPVTDRLSERLQRWFPSTEGLFRAVGCVECGQTGYRGRMAVTEVMIVDGDLERIIAGAATTDQIADAARRAGSRSVWEAGVEHARAGHTSIDELQRVLEIPIPASGVQGTRSGRPVPEAAPAAPP